MRWAGEVEEALRGGGGDFFGSDFSGPKISCVRLLNRITGTQTAVDRHTSGENIILFAAVDGPAPTPQLGIQGML